MTLPDASFPTELQYAAHAVMSLRRFSSASERRYAASVLFSIAWASAASTTSRANAVLSPAQSRNEERKPCVVTSTLRAAQHRFQCRVVEGLPALDAWKYELRHAGLMQLGEDCHGAL